MINSKICSQDAQGEDAGKPYFLASWNLEIGDDVKRHAQHDKIQD